MDKMIITERLTVKPFAEADKAALAGLLTNEQIKETFMIPDFPTGEALSAAVDKLYRASLADEHFERGIFLGNTLIGFVNEVEAPAARSRSVTPYIRTITATDTRRRCSARSSAR